VRSGFEVFWVDELLLGFMVERKNLSRGWGVLGRGEVGGGIRGVKACCVMAADEMK